MTYLIIGMFVLVFICIAILFYLNTDLKESIEFLSAARSLDNSIYYKHLSRLSQQEIYHLVECDKCGQVLFKNSAYSEDYIYKFPQMREGSKEDNKQIMQKYYCKKCKPKENIKE